MMDLIKDLEEISNKCISYGDCWANHKCPMHLTDDSNPINTRCVFRLLMYKLSKNTPNKWLLCLREIDEILGEEEK